MKINEYFRKYCVNQSEFARRIGKSGSFVIALSNGRAKPSIETAQKIHEVTNGEVTINDW